MSRELFWALITMSITHQPTNSTLPQPLRSRNAPTYQISAKSDNPRLIELLMVQQILPARFFGGESVAPNSHSWVDRSAPNLGKVKGLSQPMSPTESSTTPDYRLAAPHCSATKNASYALLRAIYGLYEILHRYVCDLKQLTW